MTLEPKYKCSVGMVDIHGISFHPCLLQAKHCFAEKLVENSENSLLLIL